MTEENRSTADVRLERIVRLLPAPPDGNRVETGAVQFGDDWPGVFIRGDNAGYYAMLLYEVIADNGMTPETNKTARLMLAGLYNTLRGSILSSAAEMLPVMDMGAMLQPNAQA